MKGLVARSVVGFALVCALGLSASGTALAAHSTADPTTQRAVHETYVHYQLDRRKIQRQFEHAVHVAHVAFVDAMAMATTSAQRSTAQQAWEAAIIKAATKRSIALTLLGPPPPKLA